MSNKQFSSHCIQKNQTYCDLRHVLLPLLFTVGIDHSKYDILNLHTRSNCLHMSRPIQKGVIPLTCRTFKLIPKVLDCLFTIRSTTSNCPYLQAQKTCCNTLQNSFLAKFCLLCNPKRIDEPLLCSMVLEIQSFFRSTVRLVFS